MNFRAWLAGISQTLLSMEKTLLVVSLLSMLLLAVAQIFLRNVLGFGLIWSDTLVRILVLWTAMLGAMIASRRDNHIRIDVLVRLLPARVKPWADCLAKGLTALICALASWYSAGFVYLEFQDGIVIFADVPSWVCALIIPAGFGLMTLRYLGLAWQAFPDLNEGLEERPDQ